MSARASCVHGAEPTPGHRHWVCWRTCAPALLLLSALSAQAQTVTEYQLPADSNPFLIVAGPDGQLWFTQTTESGFVGTSLGRVTTEGVYSEVGSTIRGYNLMSGPDGAVWVASHRTHSIVRFRPDGTETAFHLPPPATEFPFGVAAGPDGNVWYTHATAGTVGRMTLDGVFTEFPLPDLRPTAIIQPGPDGALWFTADSTSEPGDWKLRRITTDGVTTPAPLLRCQGRFVFGADGRIWLPWGPSSIAALTVATGDVQYYELPVPGSRPGQFGITLGPDQAVWFVEEGRSHIGRITTSGEITEYPVPSGADLTNAGIVAGPDGGIWFTEPSADRVGRVAVPSVPCVSDATTLCLAGGRFRVRASYDTDDRFGQGNAVALTADTGYFWFFAPSNIEVVVKVLDACSISQSFWVFAGGLTNVGVDLVVTDTQTGVERTYSNPRGTAYEPLQQTEDFPVCQ